MIKVLPRNILRFIFLILLQALVLNNIQFSGFVNPFIYILFILLLPFETPNWLLIFLGFGLGFSVDLFSHTPGMHASATVFIAFLRPYVLNIIAPRDGYEPGTFPRIFYYGLTWFLKYTLILVLAHHFFLFFIEVFKFEDFIGTTKRILFSSVFSILLITFSQYFIYRK